MGWVRAWRFMVARWHERRAARLWERADRAQARAEEIFRSLSAAE